jgi:hypothetical protein
MTYRLVNHNPIWKGIQPKDKRKPGKRTNRNHGLLGRTVEADSNSYRESSLEFSNIITFSLIPLQRLTQTELRDEVPFRGEDCHNS